MSLQVLVTARSKRRETDARLTTRQYVALKRLQRAGVVERSFSTRESDSNDRHWAILNLSQAGQAEAIVKALPGSFSDVEVWTVARSDSGGFCSGCGGRETKVDEVGSPGAHCEQLGEQIGDLEQKEQAGTLTQDEQGDLNSKRELWEMSSCGIVDPE